MKHKTKYDLLEMINTANGNINLTRNMLDELKIQVLVYGLSAVLNSVNKNLDGVAWGPNLIFCSGLFVLKVSARSCFQNIFKSERKIIARKELSNLVVDLENILKINTSLDLLMESKVSKVEYRGAIVEKVPILKQNKYILIPAYDGLENIRQVSVLQEHELGSNEFFLSRGTPKKIKVLKPAYNSF